MSEQLDIELEALRKRVKELEAALLWFAEEYARTHFMREADMHEQGCRCLRCAHDNARAVLQEA